MIYYERVVPTHTQTRAWYAGLRTALEEEETRDSQWVRIGDAEGNRRPPLLDSSTPSASKPFMGREEHLALLGTKEGVVA